MGRTKRKLVTLTVACATIASPAILGAANAHAAVAGFTPIPPGTHTTRCTVPGDLVRFDPIWGPETPTCPGVEVVLDARGAVVSTATTRGTALQPGQTSIQATGSDAAALLNLINGGGRLKTTTELFDNGEPVPLTLNTQATNGSTGSPELVANGSVINTPSGGSERPDGDALVWVP